MRVIVLVPVWAVLATVNTALPRLHYITAIFLDLYEAFAILSFMQLIYHYLGGKDQAEYKATLKHPYRFLGCLCLLTPGEKMIKVPPFFFFFFSLSFSWQDLINDSNNKKERN